MKAVGVGVWQHSGRNSKVDDGLPLHSAVSKYGNPGAGADAADHCEAC